MKKISKIRELALIICVLALMKGVVSHASELVALYTDQKSASSASITVTNYDISVWGNTSSASKYPVEFIVPDGSSNAYRKIYAPGESFSPIVRGVYNVTSTNLNLYGNSKDDQKKECIASGGIAD